MSLNPDRNVSGRGEPSAEDTGTMAHTDRLATRLSELARELQREKDLDSMLAKMVATAVQMVPGAEDGSISVVRGRRHVHSRVPTGDLPTRVDDLQNELGEGPCMDAVYEQQTVRVNDLRTADRWPRFADRAAEAGALSMLAFQLYVEGDNLGALNLFSSRPGAFDDESEHIGLLFAAHAAVAFADREKREQLQDALATRDLIGQAKGILMERLKTTPEQAFLLLAQVSQETNTKLVSVAEQLVRSGVLDPRADRRDA